MNEEARHNRGLKLSAVTCVLAAAVLFFGPYLARVDLFYDDAAHHIFWLYQYADPQLFPEDISIAYFHTSAPWGYRGLYAAIAPLTDVLQASEWIAVLLLAISALLVWRIAAASVQPDGELYALLAVLVLVAFLPLSQQQDFLPTTGFQRAFALPLILLTLWALVSRSYAWVGISWLAAALIYPVVLPVQGLTAATVFLRELLTTRRMPSRWIFNGLLGAGALALAAFGLPVPAEIGPAFTYEQAMQMPAFGRGGRLDFYQPGMLSWVRDYSSGLGWRPGLMLLMAAGVGSVWVFKRRIIPFPAWVMVWVGAGLWAAMRLFPEELMFGLYLPNRHSRWALGIFGVLAIAAGVMTWLEKARDWWTRRFPQRTSGIHRWIAIVAPLVAVAALLPTALRLWNRPVNTDLENVYAFIATLPNTALVAAHPDLADFVPLRAHRSVLTSSEISMPWMEGYYAKMKPRVEASLRAAYATRIDEMDAALGPFGVDVMLSGPEVWSKTGYFAPFDELARSLQQRGAQEGFALQKPPAERTLFKSGEYHVIRVGPCSSDC